MLRPMRSVAWLSTAGLLVYLYIIFLVGYFGASAPPRQAPLVYADASQFGAWFGPSLFAFEGMGTVRVATKASNPQVVT